VLTRREDRGAVAVEFALVLPILVLLLTAIIDYGLWFSDSIGLRQGVREAARVAVTGAGYDGACAGSGAAKTACMVKLRTGGIGGIPVTRVFAESGGNAWQKGEALTVCSVLKEDGLTGLAPLPGGRYLRSVVSMRIEIDQVNGDQVDPGDPSGDNWSWCPAPAP
jgi:hypothetical protein